MLLNTIHLKSSGNHGKILLEKRIIQH